MPMWPSGEAWGTRRCLQAAPSGTGTPLWSSGNSQQVTPRPGNKMVVALQGAVGTSGDFCPAGLPPAVSVHVHCHLSVCPSIYLCPSFSRSLSISVLPYHSAFLNPSISLPSPSILFLLLFLTPPHILFPISPLPIPFGCVCVCVCFLSSPFFYLLNLSLCLCFLCPHPPFLSLHSPPLSPGLSSKEPSPPPGRGAVPLMGLLPSSPSG
uniref:Uncharacterized protein n=1 Tax=Pipistrellus kuhlii TaxID=59472 RepID=A0A7J7Y9A0_PIPKU|nr:hypothetical protein mPipKuh1_010363 [Pipistrellus kuhlii]